MVDERTNPHTRPGRRTTQRRIGALATAPRCDRTELTMAVRYDTIIGGFVIEDDYCPDCEQPLYDSGCDAPGCNGRACQDCGTGCDYDFVDAADGGHCRTAAAEESDEERAERHNAERAAFGLPSLDTQQGTPGPAQPTKE